MSSTFPDLIFATHDRDGLPCLVLALSTTGNALLFVDDAGRFRWDTFDQFTADWRFDHNRHVWVEVADLPEDDLDQTEAPDDGGPAVPGDLPDPDATDIGLPSDRQDREAGGVDTGEAR